MININGWKGFTNYDVLDAMREKITVQAIADHLNAIIETHLDASPEIARCGHYGDTWHKGPAGFCCVEKARLVNLEVKQA